MNAAKMHFTEIADECIQNRGKEEQARIEVMAHAIKNRNNPTEESQRREDEWRKLLNYSIAKRQETFEYLKNFTEKNWELLFVDVQSQGGENDGSAGTGNDIVAH